MEIERYKFYRDSFSECSCEMDISDTGTYVDYGAVIDIIQQRNALAAAMRDAVSALTAVIEPIIGVDPIVARERCLAALAKVQS